MTKTPNYQLPQWQLDDFIKMADFNAAFSALDSALKANADANTALSTKLAASKVCRIQIGSYVGTGVYGQNNPNTIQCSFTPAVLMVYGYYGYNGQDSGIQTAMRGMSNWGISNDNVPITFGDSSVSWYNRSGNTDSVGNQLNKSGATYYYCILGYDKD